MRFNSILRGVSLAAVGLLAMAGVVLGQSGASRSADSSSAGSLMATDYDFADPSLRVADRHGDDDGMPDDDRSPASQPIASSRHDPDDDNDYNDPDDDPGHDPDDHDVTNATNDPTGDGITNDVTDGVTNVTNDPTGDGVTNVTNATNDPTGDGVTDDQATNPDPTGTGDDTIGTTGH